MITSAFQPDLTVSLDILPIEIINSFEIFPTETRTTVDVETIKRVNEHILIAIDTNGVKRNFIKRKTNKSYEDKLDSLNKIHSNLWFDDIFNYWVKSLLPIKWQIGLLNLDLSIEKTLNSSINNSVDYLFQSG